MSSLFPTVDPLKCPLKTIRAVLQLMITPALPKKSPLLVFADESTPIPTSYLRAECKCTLKKMGVDHTLCLRKASATPAHSGGCSDLAGRLVLTSPTSKQTLTKSMTFYLNHLINHSIILLSSPTQPIFLTLAGLVYLLSQLYTILPHLIQFI